MQNLQRFTFLAEMTQPLKILSEWEWCQNQPPLFQGKGFFEASNWHSLWGPADRIPIEQEVSFQRLGHHYENLLFSAFIQNPYIEVSRNHQIVENKTTRGEIDFLIHHGSQCIHLEVSIKFYLYCPKKNQLISPSGRENWDQKREKLFDRQIPLGQKHFPKVTSSLAWVQGMIGYHPTQDLEIALKHIKNLTENHPRGYWVYASEYADYARNRFTKGALLAGKHRDRWGEMPQTRKVEFNVLEELLDQLKRGELNYLWLSTLDYSETWIVVNDHWSGV